jgi:hypothetical protein
MSEEHLQQQYVGPITKVIRDRVAQAERPIEDISALYDEELISTSLQSWGKCRAVGRCSRVLRHHTPEISGRRILVLMIYISALDIWNRLRFATFGNNIERQITDCLRWFYSIPLLHVLASIPSTVQSCGRARVPVINSAIFIMLSMYFGWH